MNWKALVVCLLATVSVRAQNSPPSPPSGADSHQTPVENRSYINEFGDNEAIESKRHIYPWIETYDEVLASALNKREFRSDVKYSDGLSTNWAGFDYEINTDWTFEVAQEWENYWGLGTNHAYSQLNDTYLQIEDSKLFTIGRDIEAISHLRLYLPTGQDSRDMGQYVHLRYELATAKIFTGDVKLKYVTRPELYLQHYLAYYDKIEQEIMGTKYFEWWNFLDFEWQFKRHFFMHQVLGLRDIFRYGDANYQVPYSREEDFVGDTAFVYMPSDYFNLRVGIYEEDMDLMTQDRKFVMYRDDDASYYVSCEISY